MMWCYITENYESKKVELDHKACVVDQAVAEHNMPSNVSDP